MAFFTDIDKSFSLDHNGSYNYKPGSYFSPYMRYLNSDISYGQRVKKVSNRVSVGTNTENHNQHEDMIEEQILRKVDNRLDDMKKEMVGLVSDLKDDVNAVVDEVETLKDFVTTIFPEYALLNLTDATDTTDSQEGNVEEDDMPPLEECGDGNIDTVLGQEVRDYLPNTYYAKGDKVRCGNKIYKSNVGYTTGNTAYFSNVKTHYWTEVENKLTEEETEDTEKEQEQSWFPRLWRR